MKLSNFKKVSIFLICLITVSNIQWFSANAEENTASTSSSSLTEIAFVDPPVDFRSFFAPEGQICQGSSCDWRASKSGHGFIDYPRCEKATDTNCIRSIEHSIKNSEYARLEFFAEINWSKININSTNLQMTGGAPSIWTSRDENGNIKYFLVKIFSGFGWSSLRNAGEPFLDKIEMRILPVTLSGFDRFDNLTRFYCIDSGITNCFKEIDFETDSRIRVTVNTPTSLGGFFMGRIADPIVKQNINSETGQNEIQLAAAPVRVPLISTKIPETATIPANLNLIRKGEVNRYPSYDGGWNEYFDFASKFTDDRVSKYSTQWSVYAISPVLSSYWGCQRSVNGFIGTGTTNAMRYDFNPPAFSDGAFTFKLSGLHFQPNGVNLELGQYELVLNSEFAKCLYKTTNVPLVAKVEITSANGEKNITTTTSQERDGWFKLQIAALTFSMKTIKVSLAPEEPMVIAPTPEEPKVIAPTPKPTKIIECKKGSQIKKIKAVKPACPKGWKLVKKN